MAVLSVGCADQSIEPMENIGNDIISRSMNPYSESTSNPTLATDWENLEEITDYRGWSIITPWNLETSMGDYEFAQDIKKEDGWTMLFHTFKGINMWPKENYIVLYNKLTGWMKVFYYVEQSTDSNHGIWTLRSQLGTTDFFNLNQYIALPDNTAKPYDEIELSNVAQSKAHGFNDGWNGFQIEIPYITDIENQSFHLSSYYNEATSYNFQGQLNIETEGSIIKTYEKPNNQNIQNGIANIGSNKAKALIDKMKEKSDQGMASDNTGAIKAKFGTRIINALSKVKQGDIKSAILGGLNLIFGTSTVQDTYTVNLSSTGNITYTGEGYTLRDTSIPAISIPLFDIMNPGISSNNLELSAENMVLPEDGSMTRSGEKVFPGVWTLASAPKLYPMRYSPYKPKPYDGGYITPVLEYGTCSYEILINPELQPYITSQSSSYEIISLAKQNGNNLPNEYIQYGFPTPLIYEDDYMTLNESYMSMDNSIEVGSMWALPPSGYDYYFDWGKYDVNELVVITLNLTYNYNGKEKKVSFSRTYKPEFVYSDAADKRIFITGQYKTPYIINTGEYPLGQKANILSTEEELHENDSIMSNIQ